MATRNAQYFIKGALRCIASYQSGEPIAPLDAQDGLDVLNDLLDSWSTQEEHVYGSIENIVFFVAGQAQYKIGNPLCTDIGSAPFTGTLSGGSAVVTGVNPIPSNLAIGATVTDLQNLLPIGTTVIAIAAAGPNTVTLSVAPTLNSNGADLISYTVPGDFPFDRPLRITHGFTRLSSLDFPIEVTMDQSRYVSILYKAQPGPWPTVAWYNNTHPYGLINFYQTPGNSAECHLFTDTILANLTLTQTFTVPQGYARAIKWNLAKEICAEYGYPLSEAIKENAKESLKAVKSLNAQPAQVSRYDAALVSSPRGDYGGILRGWYY